MFGQILDLILFPIKELLKLLVDQRITDYLGFSPMAGIVTLLVIFIVVKALVNTTYVGPIVDSTRIVSDRFQKWSLSRFINRNHMNDDG